VLSCASLAILFTGQVVGLAGFIICGGYALYLYRGGRFVIWFW
jgi:hypothetical protein